MSLLLTLVGGLGGFGDIDSELATEGIHSHHSRVDGGVGEGGELVVVAGDAVERFGDVCSSFQDYFLQDKKEKKKIEELPMRFWQTSSHRLKWNSSLSKG